MSEPEQPGTAEVAPEPVPLPAPEAPAEAKPVEEAPLEEPKKSSEARQQN